MFIAYVYKLNAIFMIPMKSREDDSMIAAFEEVYTKLEGLGHKPQLHILDNECSKCIQNSWRKRAPSATTLHLTIIASTQQNQQSKQLNTI